MSRFTEQALEREKVAALERIATALEALVPTPGPKKVRIQEGEFDPDDRVRPPVEPMGVGED